jgi:putative flippase GtrA
MLLEQLFHFALVGGLGALLDWTLFNLFSSRWFDWQRISSSVVSTSCATTWSFFANWLLVFRPIHDSPDIRILRFLLITCFSGLILQTFVIRIVSWGFTYFSSVLSKRASFCIHDHDLFERNIAKLTAMAVGFFWNFYWYHEWVFAD